MKKTFYLKNLVGLGLMFLLFSCAPKEDIQFKEVKDIVVESNAKGEPILKGRAIFFNPNKIKMKLRKANIEILVNDKKSAFVKQDYNLTIMPQSDFEVPVEAQLALKEIGLLDAIMGLFGGKKYKVQFVGTISASVHGVRVRVPVNYSEEMRIKL